MTGQVKLLSVRGQSVAPSGTIRREVTHVISSGDHIMRPLFNRPPFVAHRGPALQILLNTNFNMPESASEYVSLDESNQQSCFANIMGHPRERKMFIVIVILSVAVAVLMSTTVYYAKHGCSVDPVHPTTVIPPTSTHVYPTTTSPTTKSPTTTSPTTTTPQHTTQPPTSSTELPTRSTHPPTRPTHPPTRSTHLPTSSTETSPTTAPTTNIPTSSYYPVRTTEKETSVYSFAQDTGYWYPTVSTVKVPKTLKHKKKPYVDDVYF
ncbi:hypothetical protein J6590_023194 [Homalodisca vitripennis]|nr:hypothetical protein J6590_023194 [Homalodisca vitripennis]